MLVFVALLIHGCKQKLEDVSSAESFKKLIGKEFYTTKPLRIHGITMDTNYRKVIDHYTLTKEPGMSGPEVVFSSSVPVGAIVNINKVLQCSNCIFGSPIAIQVDLNIEGLQKESPVLLYGLRVTNDDGTISIDPSFFDEK